VVFAQDGQLTPPPEGTGVKTVLSDIQAKVNQVQSLKATMEFDRKDEDEDKKKKKDKPKNPNPAWPEPAGRDVERGPMEISRGTGAYLKLERKNEQAQYVANSASIWKYDVDDKEAQHIPSNWPVISDYVTNALRMNIFVAMDEDTLKLKGSQPVDGLDCWVIEGKSPSNLKVVGVDSVKLKLWVCKQDGIPRMIKVPSEKDSIIRLKDVQLNVPVDGSKFSFSPPSGVETKNIFGF